VATDGLIFLSGQIAQDPASGKLIEGDVSAQARQILSNVAVVLKDLDRSFRDVAKVNVYLTSMKDFAAMNEVYAATFAAPYPARTTVAVLELPMGARVEMEMVVNR
jgi:2-iminobutanoate/2-iminopropanoate deaminase